MNCTVTSAVLAMVLLAANPLPPAGDAMPAPRPSTAVVGGKHVQPRAASPDGTRAGQDVSPAEADEVEQLYQQLMREPAPDAAQAKGAKPPQ